MNAQNELLSKLNGRVIKCASIYYGNEYDDDRKHFILKIGYTNKEYDDFINSLDFEYDDGYGGQELFGCVWFNDSWLERGEYDGSEWWNDKKYPDIPKELKANK